MGDDRSAFLDIVSSRQRLSQVCFSQIQVTVNNGEKPRRNWIIFLCWRKKPLAPWISLLVGSTTSWATQEGFSEAWSVLLAAGENPPKILSCSSCCANQPWSYSGDGFVFLQLRQGICRHCAGEFSVIAWCFNPSPAEVGVLPRWFLLLYVKGWASVRAALRGTEKPLDNTLSPQNQWKCT